MWKFQDFFAFCVVENLNWFLGLLFNHFLKFSEKQKIHFLGFLIATPGPGHVLILAERLRRFPYIN
jgi:hypothetical protein